MSTSPSPYFGSLPSATPETTFTSPSNFRSLPPPSPPEAYAHKFAAAVATTFTHLEYFISSLFSLVTLAAPHGVLSTSFPRSFRLSKYLPLNRYLLNDTQTSVPDANARRSSAGGGAGVAMLAQAQASIGIQQADHDHGRPDQTNFADGAGGVDSALGQSTYAKQC